MIQEYLFLNRNDKDKIKQFNENYKDEIAITIKDYGKKGAYRVQYVLEGNNESLAKRLSELDTRLTDEYSPITLTNGASTYFNKHLYPLFNEFERNLRKVIYLASAYNDGGNEAKKLIDEIEEYDFGELYKNLFTDEVFKNDIRKKFGNNQHYSKNDMLTIIQDMGESTIWEKIIGNRTLKCIPENFLIIRNYRNDTMHAHNIHYNDYIHAKNILTKINNELIIEINKYLNSNEIIESLNISSILESLKQASEAIVETTAKLINTEQLKAFINAVKLAQNSELIEDLRNAVVNYSINERELEKEHKNEEEQDGQVENGN